MIRRADNLSDLGALPDAVEGYLEALSALPDPKGGWRIAPGLYRGLGMGLVDASRFDEAVEALLRAEQLLPGEDAERELALGDSYRHLGRGAEALQRYQEAVRIAGTAIFIGHDEAHAFATAAGLVS